MTFSKILVGVDGSEESILAASTAIKIASQNKGAEVIALHVIEIPSFIFYHTDDMAKELALKGKAEVEKWLSQTGNLSQESNVKLMTHVIVSIYSAYSEIIKYAEEQSVDLIVVGTRGRTGLKKLLLGSTALGVVNYEPCTVTVVR